MARVRDTGAGFLPERAEHLFEPYTQSGGPHTDTVHAGLGLGLAIAREIMTPHGGRITAHSEGPGRGAEFVLRLPSTDVADFAVASAQGHSQA